jgi:PhzF family phenazine biosynthesis protein
MGKNDQAYRLSAFPAAPGGGNPAGVWIGNAFPPDERMQAMAIDVGYSETAFLVPAGNGRYNVRYFSPAAEVPFCGHATIAAGVVLGRRAGPGVYELATPAGDVRLETGARSGRFWTSLTSVTPRHEDINGSRLDAYLASFSHARDVLDPSIPAVIAFAGARHLVLAFRDRATLAGLDYDFDALRGMMLEDDLTTIQAVWRERGDRWHARNPFPVGGVVEDPATGAAAAALGGYLRDAGLLDAPTDIVVLQGEDMGRPSRLEVGIPEAGGIVVTGTAVFL